MGGNKFRSAEFREFVVPWTVFNVGFTRNKLGQFEWRQVPLRNNILISIVLSRLEIIILYTLEFF